MKKDKINLEGRVKLNDKYKGKSKFDFWKKAQAGDIIHIEMPFSILGTSSGGGLYSPRIILRNESEIERNTLKKEESDTKESEIYNCDFNSALIYISKCGGYEKVL